MAILMEKDYWMNSQFSIARFFGGIEIGGEEFWVLGPADDLVMKRFVKYYNKLGRDRFIKILESHQHDSKESLQGYFESETKTNTKTKTNKNKVEEPTLFG